MVVVPAGSFAMGSPSGEEGRFDDQGPLRGVRIGAPFAVGVYEVTFAEWDACVSGAGCGHAPDDSGWGRDGRPVINVSWNDAWEYVQWLSAQTGAPYRLPTEAEWEYVVRAGTTTPFHTGETTSTDQANYDGNHAYGDGRKGVYRKRTTPVGTFGENPWALRDVHGNVWEWTEDCWNDNYMGAPVDGGAWETGDCEWRVARGGSWINKPRLLRSASRFRYTAGRRNDILGFRVARTLEEREVSTRANRTPQWPIEVIDEGVGGSATRWQAVATTLAHCGKVQQRGRGAGVDQKRRTAERGRFGRDSVAGGQRRPGIARGGMQRRRFRHRRPCWRRRQRGKQELGRLHAAALRRPLRASAVCLRAVVARSGRWRGDSARGRRRESLARLHGLRCCPLARERADRRETGRGRDRSAEIQGGLDSACESRREPRLREHSRNVRGIQPVAVGDGSGVGAGGCGGALGVRGAGETRAAPCVVRGDLSVHGQVRRWSRLQDAGFRRQPAGARLSSSRISRCGWSRSLALALLPRRPASGSRWWSATARTKTRR